MKIFKITAIAVAALILIVVAAGIYVKTALPDTGPAPDITIERTPVRLERGKYLANHVAVCMDCHSKRDWNLFAGPIAAHFGGGGEKFDQQMGFPGVFYAPNITPYALGEWSDGEIFRAITTGVTKEGRALFPLMAYHRFGQLDQEDIYSIIAYIRELPPVKKDIPRSQADFPVNYLINTMPQKANFTKLPSMQDQLGYGKYLITASGCVDCHSKTDKGSVIKGSEFGGGMEFVSPHGIVRSANITMHKETGIGSWSKQAFIKRFKAYADSSYISPKLQPGELNTPMPWTMYAGIQEADLEAIYAYLASITPIENRVIRLEKKTSK
ncbi:c-type cytochrome [Rhodocytophaga rosea]|uniref:C-type cytochrome n=1 Tax=Rhodocytophaga rosea TaxID=2704465 RepID=A0A6C0GG42_9BACT|nr:c-type cytochrome [Rhodocytophaga rosea]QHT66976.1 c-type cytochrome [Rhodocytophaga rosea]